MIKNFSENNTVEKITILKFNSEKFEKREDDIIMETPLTIFVNDYELVTLMCLPANREELAVGFLFSESIIDSFADIDEISFKLEKTAVKIKINKKLNLNFFRKRTLTSGCGGGMTFKNIKDCAEAENIDSQFKIGAEHICDMMTEMLQKADFFNKTGGTHISALADREGIIFTFEDIGRHNTLDKIIGRSAKNKINLKNKIIFSSGRISSEMVAKVLKSNIPLLVSHSAPTSAAVKMAEDRNLTLVGFCRGKRMNIYSGEERIY
ncbi:MAG: formate dehydrogenase accessory sulfurtransferase FdhD [Bacillota bacterium]